MRYSAYGNGRQLERTGKTSLIYFCCIEFFLFSLKKHPQKNYLVDLQGSKSPGCGERRSTIGPSKLKRKDPIRFPYLKRVGYIPRKGRLGGKS